MTSRRLLEEIEKNASELTADLIAAIRQDPRAQAYHALSQERLRALAIKLYQNLGYWLRSRTEPAVKTNYERLGRQRFHSGIPMEQMVFGLTLTKTQLVEFIRRALPGDSAERDMELELIVSIGQFFDKAVYHAVAGYEDSRKAAMSADLSKADHEVPAEFRAGKRDPEAEMDYGVGRGGAVGEVSG